MTVEARLASDGVVGSIDPRWVAAVQSPVSSGKIDRLAEVLPPHSGCLQNACLELLLVWGPPTESSKQIVQQRNDRETQKS